MIQLRVHQMQAIETQKFEQFVERMCIHLRREFPAEFEDTCETDLRETVRIAIARARHYRLSSARDLCRYLNLCAVFGWEFDANPSLRSMLRDRRIASPSARLQRVFAACVRRLEVEEYNAALAAEPPAKAFGSAAG